MLKKIAVAFCAFALLSGCSSGASKYKDSNSHIDQFEREVGDRVFFTFNSSNLSSEAKQTLTRQAIWLNDHKLFNITIEGHCDERGTREYNIALGERRAHSVKNFLVEHGLDTNRMETISYGKERPAVIGSNEEAWRQNRRAVIEIK